MRRLDRVHAGILALCLTASVSPAVWAHEHAARAVRPAAPRMERVRATARRIGRTRGVQRAVRVVRRVGLVAGPAVVAAGALTSLNTTGGVAATSVLVAMGGVRAYDVGLVTHVATSGGGRAVPRPSTSGSLAKRMASRAVFAGKSVLYRAVHHTALFGLRMGMFGTINLALGKVTNVASLSTLGAVQMAAGATVVAVGLGMRPVRKYLAERRATAGTNVDAEASTDHPDAPKGGAPVAKPAR